MQAEEAQLQYMHLYKKMDAVYYQMAIAQKLTPSEMDIYYTICVLGDGCLQRDVCNLALTSKQTINSALKKMEKQGDQRGGNDFKISQQRGVGGRCTF